MLPYIRLGLKSALVDLRTAALFGIAQIASRKSLTKDYSLAFFRQILLSLSEVSSSEDELERKLLVLVLLAQF